jgi:phosphinothricin acetyltransferase
MSVRIRPARLDDLGPITEIYNHYVVSTAITFDIDPVPAEDRHAWFLEHTTGAGHLLLVAEDGGRIVGYAGTGTFRGTRAYDTTVETTIYITSRCEQRGLGTRLYAALFEALAGSRCPRGGGRHPAESRPAGAPRSVRLSRGRRVPGRTTGSSIATGT